jgi:ubiquinone/menaquinone biosynthesis C-methylase UbiE
MTERTSADGERDRWERLLSTGAEAEFREFVLDHLDLDDEDTILSVGCGPGFETAALAERVGEDGHVIGVDVNEGVLTAAGDRCAAYPQVSFGQGDITNLPVADASVDYAIAKQVFYAVSDVESALAELVRVVRPGGRVAVTATERRTHTKHTPTHRMETADELYRSEMGDRGLGTRLVALLPEAGFTVADVVPRAKIKTEIDDQVEQGIDVQRGLLEASDSFDDAAVEAWERDVRELDEAGRFLSCTTSFLYLARKPE